MVLKLLSNYIKKETGILPYIIQKNELKMDHRHICKG